ncbi:signal transduction histidine kinase [Bacteriovorax stolpii]|nr:HAMP domain-containing sensor histidine kinase [Bacteriovorax stolpii]TDP51165.1 signal transduction histidine kinase [Bacteriovorax stolpii]
MPESSPYPTDPKIIAEQKKFEALFYGCDTPMVLFKGPELIYEMFNEKYQSIYPGRDLLTKPLLVAVPELQDSLFPKILKKVYETGEAFFSQEGLACILNKTTGAVEERYFDTTFSRISYGEGEPYRILATPREVTARVLNRKKLEDSLRELQEEKDLRERFVSALTHDLRTPMAIAKVGSQIIKLNKDKQDVIVETADRIAASVDRADRMIRDLLDANRLKVGAGINVTLQECHLELIVSYVVNDLEKLHGKRFQVKCLQDLIIGHWDNLAIHRMIENLASNAIKYGSYDSDVIITLKCENGFAEIAIHNEGKPISKEDQALLFTHFGRSSTALKSGQTGWGIGLALVKGLAEAHAGSVRVESSAETGTTFFVSLPLEPKKK